MCDVKAFKIVERFNIWEALKIWKDLQCGDIQNMKAKMFSACSYKF